MVTRCVAIGLALLLAGCESAVPALDAAPDLSVERLELVSTVPWNGEVPLAFVMPDGSLSGQHIRRVQENGAEDHAHWDDRLGARIMSP